MTDDTTQTTLRDTISSAVNTVEQTNVEKVEQVSQPPEQSQSVSERSRDEQGRFSPKTADKTNVTVTPAPVTTPKPKPQRPSSWKKDYWPHWDKLTAGQQLTPEEALAIAEYTAQREQDFAKGVSTYKSEWDRAKPVLEALNPITPLVQQYGFTDASQWLQTAVGTFRSLAGGNPQQKLQTFFQLAAQYQVPLEEVFEQDENGRFYLNPQRFQQVKQLAQPTQQPQQDVRQVVKELLMEEAATKQVQELSSNKDQYPYLEQVRETMAGLLRAELVEDLKSAYEAALRMPQHKDLFEELQAKQREADELRQREEASRVVDQARAKAVSPRSSTPANPVKTEKDKGLRSTIEDAINKVSGRV